MDNLSLKQYIGTWLLFGSLGLFAIALIGQLFVNDVALLSNILAHWKAVTFLALAGLCMATD